MSKTDKYIGQRIREARLAKGWSQSHLGEAMDPPVTFQQIQKRERGVNRTPPADLIALSKALDRPVEFFMPGGGMNSGRGRDDPAVSEFLTSQRGVAMAMHFPKLSEASQRTVLDLVHQLAGVA